MVNKLFVRGSTGAPPCASHLTAVIPAQAGIHLSTGAPGSEMDPGLRRGDASRVGTAPSSEPQRLGPHDVGDGADMVEQRVGQRLVDLDEADGVGAFRCSSEMEGCDVDAVL